MLPLLVFIILILLIDGYTYKGLRTLCKTPERNGIPLFLNIVFWLVPLTLILSVILMIYLRSSEPDPRIFNGHFYVIAFTLLFYLPKLVFIFFHILEDIVFITEKIYKFILTLVRQGKRSALPRRNIRRSFFSRAGIVIAIIYNAPRFF
jgi:hypothetical protein